MTTTLVKSDGVIATCSTWTALTCTDQQEICEFLDAAHTAGPFQDPAFCGVLGSGLYDQWIVIRKSGRLLCVGYAIENCALSRYLPGLRCLSFPYGPVISDAEDLKAVLLAIERIATERGMVYVDVAPHWTNASIDAFHRGAGTLGWVAASPPGMTLRLELTATPDDLLSQMHKNARYEIRRAEKIGLDVQQARSETQYRKFYSCYRALTARKGFNCIDFEVFSRLMARLERNPDRGALLVVAIGNKLLGGVVTLRSGPCLYYLYGATTDDHKLRKMPIGYCLHWRAIQWARELGLRYYDFGGYSLDQSDSVARFKAKFGGSVVRIAPQYRRVLRPNLYSLSDQLRKLKSLPMLMRITEPAAQRDRDIADYGLKGRPRAQNRRDAVQMW